MTRLFKSKVFNAIKRINKRRLKNKSFSLFSNDCWGGELYKYFELEYNTPFIGLYLMAPCYISFLKDPKKYLDKELKFKKYSKYEQVEKTMSKIGNRFPVGIIDDIEIQFMHYKSEEDALKKWNRRKSRINWDNLYIKFDGNKDGANDLLIESFNSITNKKICLLDKNGRKTIESVLVLDWETDGAVMFKKSIKYFDVVLWLNKGKVKNTFVNNLLSHK